MGIRESLNKNPLVTTGLTAGIILLAIIVIIWQLMGGGPTSLTDQFYYIEEGKTEFADCFVDDAKKIPPIDHNGKPAYKAYVFKGQDGKLFVGYVEAFDPESKRKLEENAKLPERQRPPMGSGAIQLMVKKPTDKNWVPIWDPRGQAITRVDGESVTP